MKPDERPLARLCLDSYFDAQKQALIQEFTHEMTTCVMAITRNRLAICARFNKWDVCKLRGVKIDSAIVVQKPGGIPELWVRRSYSRYRQAFVSFLRQWYSASLAQLPREWDVDHLQSTHRFKAGHPHHYIRLVLVPRSINASYGAGFEKLFYSIERERFPNEGICIDWVALLKVLGTRLPGKPAGLELWQLWAWRTAGAMEREGIAQQTDAYVGISAILNLGYTGSYRSFPVHHTFRDIAGASGVLERYADWFGEDLISNPADSTTE